MYDDGDINIYNCFGFLSKANNETSSVVYTLVITSLSWHIWITMKEFCLLKSYYLNVDNKSV